MKKIISAITAAAAILAAVPFTAHGEELDKTTYVPTFTLKAKQSDSAQVLPSGVLYINTKAKSGADSITAPAELYVKDELKMIGQMHIKWVWKTDSLTVSSVKDPVSAGLPAVYDSNAADYAVDAVLDDSKKMAGISYYNTHNKPLVPTAASTDETPLAVFDINVKASAPADYYDLSFKTEQPDITNLVYRIGDGDFRDVRPSGENAKDMKIAVSDRKLGDINNDGILDAKDATMVLTDYAKRSADKDAILDKAQTIAADVNGNLIVDAVDATKILSYYAYTSTHDQIDLVDYVSGNYTK